MVQLPRTALVDALYGAVLRGLGVRLVGGRGMGKSVTLRILAQRLREVGGTGVALIEGPPLAGTLTACLDDVAKALGVPTGASSNLREVVDAATRTHGFERVVFLFDEVDQYVQRRVDNEPLGRVWLNHVESTRRNDPRGRVGVVAAGGLGLLYLEHVIGSHFASRAETVAMTPLSREELVELAAPFADHGPPLPDGVIDAIQVMTAGVPALVTFALGALWPLSTAGSADVLHVFKRFRRSHAGFIDDVRSAVTHPDLFDAPSRVLSHAQSHAGAVSRELLLEACTSPDSSRSIPLDRVVELLQAAGLAALDGHPDDDPVAVRALASVLTPPSSRARAATVSDRFVAEVATVLAQMHRLAKSFYAKGRGLVDEEVLSASLAIGLDALGWDTDCEPVQVGGFVDVKARLRDVPGHFLIEAKKYSNDDAADVQEQVDHYRVSDTKHAVVVMFGDEIPAKTPWPDAYTRRCLAGLTVERMSDRPDLVAHLRATDARGRVTDHLLVAVPRR
ncbi:MAG: ATP-binding protein [Polyangiales bacterium]